MKDFLSLVESEAAQLTLTKDQKRVLESMRETGWDLSGASDQVVIENSKGDKFEITQDGKLKELEA